MTSLTTYKFLHQTQGLETAEQYAQTRWDAGQLCGEGWNCPIPQAVMIVLKQYQKLNLNLNEEQKQERIQSRKQAYREEYEKKRRENYFRKYGPQQTSS